MFAYDPATKTGNRAFPYFVPFGFRAAREDVLKQIAYPNFGPTKGRWFLTRSNSVREVFKAMTDVLSNTVMSSGKSAAQGKPQIIAPTSPAGLANTQFGEAGEWM